MSQASEWALPNPTQPALKGRLRVRVRGSSTDVGGFTSYTEARKWIRFSLNRKTIRNAEIYPERSPSRCPQ